MTVQVQYVVTVQIFEPGNRSVGPPLAVREKGGQIEISRKLWGSASTYLTLHERSAISSVGQRRFIVSLRWLSIAIVSISGITYVSDFWMFNVYVRGSLTQEKTIFALQRGVYGVTLKRRGQNPDRR